jgi:Tfp pilus assembly protein PilO
MSNSRTWSVGAGLVGVLLVVAAWFLLISPQRSEAASLREQVTQQQQFNEQVKLKTQQLKAQFASLPARQAQLAEIKQEMPDNPALPSLVRDLSSYADDAGTVLVSVTPGVPVPFAAGTSGAPATTKATETAPLLQIPTTVVVTGSYAEVTLYLQKIQSKMRRAVLIENLQLAKPTDKDLPADTVQMTITGRIFVLDSAAATQAATAATAATSTGNAN